MEHIGKILKKQTPTGSLKANMDTWSSAEEDKSASACPICKGTGFVHPLQPSGKPDYSRVVACRCTRQEHDSERLARLERFSNLGSLVRLAFTNLVPQGRSGRPESQELFSRACEAARAFATEPRGWLVFTGPSGCGKTHLAAAIANERIRLGSPVFFITTPDLLDHLRTAFNPGSEVPYDEFFDQVRNSPLLILDDLGAQSATAWAKEKLDQLLNYRFNRALPTVIVAIDPVEQMEERIRTRLSDPQLSRIYPLETERKAGTDTGGSLDPEMLRSMTFDTFDPRRANLPAEQQQNLEHAFREALEFAKSPDGWLVFVGDTGCGKTHLAASITNYRLQAGKPALFIVVPDFLDHLRSSFNPESRVSYDQLFESVRNAPVLILDDFGEQSTTPWAQEKLYQVINYRYNGRLPTVITTRCSLDDIDSPISSRLSHGKISTVWNITAPDFRTDATAKRKQVGRPGMKRRPAGR
jgi:DNA replication protein DnaC